MPICIEKAKGFNNSYWITTHNPYHPKILWSTAELLELHEWTTRHLQELKHKVTTAQDNASHHDDLTVLEY